MKSLFIGGVADGRWMEHHETQSTIDVLCYPKPRVIDYSEPSPEDYVQPECDQYRRQSMYAHRQQFNFFALASMTDRDVMQKLIENYRPVTDTGNLK